jgi:hypothetical protein
MRAEAGQLTKLVEGVIMGAWFRIGRRLEWTMLALCLFTFLILGFIMTRGALYPEARWVGWTVSAFFSFPIFLVLTIGTRWLQRRLSIRSPGISNVARPRTRLLLYLALTIPTLFSAMGESGLLNGHALFSLPATYIFIWNFGLLAFVIAVLEVLCRRIDHLSS